MASTIYTGTASQTTAYAATDIYTLAIPTSSITNVSQQGSNVVISTGATALTITGVTLAQLANANFAIQGGGAIQFGDGTSGTIADQFGNSIDFSANNNGTVVLGLGGADTISAGNGANLIYGGAGVTDPSDGGDTITTGTGNDTIYGNGGNDLINSNGGTDLVFGGVGNDTISTGALTGNVSVYGGGGFTDTVDGADSITVTSNAGNLFLTGNAGNDTIVLTASTGSASIYGGIGADTITASASAGNNLIAGGSSAGSTDVDTIVFNASGTANVTVFGGVGITDTVDGADNILISGLSAGSNAFVYGNAGNDTISVGTAGTASIYGGVGSDSITLTAAGGALTGRVQIFAGGSDGTGADTVDASAFAGNTTIFGGTGLNDSADGADRLLGGSGNDVIYGNGGADTIFSGAGNDQLSGGAGNDTFVINGAGNKAIVDFGTGTDSLFIGTAVGGINGVTVSGSTVLIDGVNTDISVSGTVPTTLIGTLDANNDGIADAGEGQLQFVTTGAAATLNGTANADLLVGNTGADVILAGNGANTVFGGAGNDQITTGTGNDLVTGGLGRDLINVGSGSDGIVQNLGDSGTFTLPTANTVSTVTFDVVTGLSTGDTIDLTDVNRTLVTSTSDVSGATNNVADNSYVFVRGTYDAASNTFVGATAGADSLLVYDADATVGTVAREAIVVVGFNGAGANNDDAQGLITLA